MSEFNRFSELPRELRDLIWSMALRDDRPGIHIFGQYDKPNRYAKGSRFLRYGDMASDTLAAPSWRRYFESFNEDRTDENISTYLVDGGLWTACQESRLIMEKRFEQSKRKPFDDETYPRHDRTKEVFKNTTTGCFDGTPLHLMTVFPHRDLFVLQHNDLEKVNWRFFTFDASMMSSFIGVMHVALEYNPKWSGELIQDGYLSDDIGAIMDGVFEIWPTVRKLWFIDRSIKRKKDTPAFREKAESGDEINAFYASDRRFLEVNGKNWSDLKKEWEYIKPVEDRSSDGFSSSLDFIDDLESELAERACPDSGIRKTFVVPKFKPIYFPSNILFPTYTADCHLQGLRLRTKIMNHETFAQTNPPRAVKLTFTIKPFPCAL